jgi:hypothetical protein
MNNLVLITSIICTPNNPLSYTSTRSVFTHEERFTQTKKTIESVKEKIPNSKIIIVECSQLNEEQTDYLTKNTDYFINLINEPDKCKNIYSKSKSLGEGTMTIEALNYIIKNDILFDNFFKITGRYWLSDSFNYTHFDNNDIIIHNIHNDKNNTCTSLYKLNKTNIEDFYNFLISNMNLMFQCIGYEVLFAIFLNLPKNNKVIHMNKIGVNGYISVSNDFIDN